MEEKTELIAFTGQSGCGKGTLAGMAEELQRERGMHILTISTGDQIRNCIQSDTYIARRMALIHNAGKRQEPPVSFALDFEKLWKEVTANTIILQEGSPRSVEQFEFMQKIVPSLIPRMKIIEVRAPDEICLDRLWKRTERDKRIDLSCDGYPGVPSLDKIRDKMNWWTDVRDELIEKVEAAGVYYSIYNIGTLEEVRAKLKKVLFG